MVAQPAGDLNGLVVRVDDRLFHGQILYGWANGWAEAIWLVHDIVAANSTERALYEEQMEGVKGGILTIDEALARYHSSGCSVGRCLLIVASCVDLKRLIDGGARPYEIHLANLGEGEGKISIADSVNLSKDDCNIIENLQADGLSICLRKLSQSETKPVVIPSE
ncbi:PTS system mannose-specific EIIAB component [bacterium BMS3Bbin04]|nr:PTS system mannose-specific EIIAB component [bacterium BMS3Bbin04]